MTSSVLDQAAAVGQLYESVPKSQSIMDELRQSHKGEDPGGGPGDLNPSHDSLRQTLKDVIR